MASIDENLPPVKMVVMNTSPQAVLAARKERQSEKNRTSEQSNAHARTKDDVAMDIRNIGKFGFKTPAQFQEFMNSAAGKMAQQVLMEVINARKLEEQAQREAMERQMRRQQGRAWFLFKSMLWDNLVHAKWIESYALYNAHGAQKSTVSKNSVAAAITESKEYIGYEHALDAFINDMQTKIDDLALEQQRLAEEEKMLDKRMELFTQAFAEAEKLMAFTPEELLAAQSMSEHEKIQYKAEKAAKILSPAFIADQKREEEDIFERIQVLIENGRDLEASSLLSQLQQGVLKRADIGQAITAPHSNLCETVDHEGTSHQFQCPMDKQVVYDQENQCHALIGADKNLHELSLQDRQLARKAFETTPGLRTVQNEVKLKDKHERQLHRQRVERNTEEYQRCLALKDAAEIKKHEVSLAHKQLKDTGLVPEPKPSAGDEKPEAESSYRQTNKKLHRNTPSPRPIRRDSRAVQMENKRRKQAPTGRHLTQEEQQEVLRNKHNMGTSTHVQDKLQPLSTNTPMPDTNPEQAPNKCSAPTPFSTKPHPKG